MSPRLYSFSSCCFWVSALCFVGCGDDAGGGDGGASTTAISAQSATSAATGMVTELFPAVTPLPGQTECKVTIRTGLPIEGAMHRPVCTPLTYGTNPPTSGNHWGSWAAYGKYTTPVPREMWVHNLEHGTIVMACGDGACTPDVLAAFDAAATAIGGDSLCALQTQGAVTNRVLVTPDPELDAPIALAAWGASYVATCIDPPSLNAFAVDHYNKATENICSNGKDPATICPPP